MLIKKSIKTKYLNKISLVLKELGFQLIWAALVLHLLLPLETVNRVAFAEEPDIGNASARAPFAKPNEGQIEKLLYASSAAQLYRARVLLESYERWPEAYDLVQSFVKNSPDLDPVFEKKLKRAARQIFLYLPKKGADFVLNRRHLVQPFLEAQYLINEVLMDMRVVLNNSVDYEVQVVEDFLKTYFFPGFEEYGVIKYPELSKYGFDLYALNPENLLASRRESSNSPLKPKPNPNGKSSNAVDPSYFEEDASESGYGDWRGGIRRSALGAEDTSYNVLPMSVHNLRALERLRIEEQLRHKGIFGAAAAPGETGPLSAEEEGTGESTPRGFLQELIDLGIAVEFIAETARDLWKSIGRGDRVMNRYLPQALMMQAIAEPGSAVMDPQLQDFLSGVRLELKVAEITGPIKEEISFLQETLGAEYVEKLSDENFVIKVNQIDKLERPGVQSYLSLSVRRPKGAARAALYLITGVGGADLSRLQLIQSSLMALRDFELIKKAGAQIPKIPGLGAAGGYAVSGYAELAKKIPDWANAMLGAAKESKNSLSALGNYVGGYTLKVVEGTNKLSSVSTKLAKSAVGKKVSAIVAHPKYQKYVKSGRILTALTVLTATAHGVIGAIEYQAEEDSDNKMEIYKNTLSKMGGTLMYLVPYVGIAAALVDTLHTVVGFPYETADLFRLYFWGAETWVYTVELGKTKTKFHLAKLEAAFVVPVDPVMYQKHLVPNYTSIDKVEAQLSGLYAYHQNTAMRHLALLYVAHRGYVDPREGVYQFGERIMHYYKEFQKTKKVFEENRTILRNRRIEAIRTKMNKSTESVPANSEDADSSGQPQFPPN